MKETFGLYGGGERRKIDPMSVLVHDASRYLRHYLPDSCGVTTGDAWRDDDSRPIGLKHQKILPRQKLMRCHQRIACRGEFCGYFFR